MDIRITRARKIYSDGRHNAFTGLAAAYGQVFITFRSAQTHLTYDGQIKVIASADMQQWRTVAEVSLPDADLRDPKLATFNGKLMVFCGARRLDQPRQSLVISSADGVNFYEPVAVRGIPEGLWLWHVRPHGGALYGTAYGKREDEYVVYLYGSDDGLNWRPVAGFPVPGGETYLEFDRDGMLWALVRDDNRGCIPTLCTARPPYTTFDSVTRLPMRLQGPMLKRLDGGCLIVCRQWDPPRRNLRSDIFWLADGCDIRRIATLPSGGDTSYASWLDTAPGRAVMSYYSAHEHKMDDSPADEASFAADPAHAEHSTAADIFLADVSYQ